MGAIRFILLFPFLLAAAVPVAVKAVATQIVAQVGGLAVWFTILNMTGQTGDGSVVGLFFSQQADPERAALIHQKMLQGWNFLWTVADWRFFLALLLAVAAAAGVAGLLVKAMAYRDSYKTEGGRK